MNNRHLLSLYTRTPLHVGSGTSVDVVDLPIMRERITGFPVIPSTSLKGVLLQAGREKWPSKTVRDGKGKDKELLDPINQMLFGAILDEKDGDEVRQVGYAGCLQILECKLLVFPVRSLAGCFAWLTCPTALRRFQRDRDRDRRHEFPIPGVDKDQTIVAEASELDAGDGKVILEEYALTKTTDDAHAKVVEALQNLVDDPLWNDKLAKRLAILHDEDFQHFVSTCTEVVARIVIDPAKRTNANLFNQENVPCEALFYSVLHVGRSRREANGKDPTEALGELLKDNPLLQIGGDETTGHGFCEVKHCNLNANA